MQNEMCLQQPAAMNGEIATRIFGLLVKQILDLRETLSFYEQELFAATTESALVCPESEDARQSPSEKGVADRIKHRIGT